MIENLNFVFTLCYGKIPLKAQTCIERNIMYCDYMGIPFRAEPYCLTPEIPDIARASDYNRFLYASKHPNVLYVDWDCLLIDLPILNPKTPKFAFTDSYGNFDSFIFYSGNNRELFSEYLEYHNREREAPDTCYWHTMKKFFSGKIMNFPQDCYKHYGIAEWTAKDRERLSYEPSNKH